MSRDPKVLKVLHGSAAAQLDLMRNLVAVTKYGEQSYEQLGRCGRRWVDEHLMRNGYTAAPDPVRRELTITAPGCCPRRYRLNTAGTALEFAFVLDNAGTTIRWEPSDFSQAALRDLLTLFERPNES